MAETRKNACRYAVVTGGNKGLGFEICRQLLSHGITVVLTARDERRGSEAVEKLKAASAGVPGSTATVLFHQLDVTSVSSSASLAGFIESRFGKLDILVNNAGIGGFVVDVQALKASAETGETNNIEWNEILTETYEVAVECIETNYYGVKRTTEALLPLLGRSDSPRIVNVSSEAGLLKNIQNEWAKGILKDAENLTEEKIEEVLSEFRKDYLKEGSRAAKAWSQSFGTYTVSKAAVSAYTRVLAKKHPGFRVNCVCPGFIKTDMNYNAGCVKVEEGAKGPVRMALLPDDGPSGLFFLRNEVSSFVG